MSAELRVPSHSEGPVATVRRAVLWVPDWPVVAAAVEVGIGAEEPAAVLHGRGLVAVSASARALGVKRGMRRRAAQRVCPELTILGYDEGRDAREFESVAVAAEQVVSGVEISRPGLLMIPSEGASRFHGSEEALAEALVGAVAEAGGEAQVGAADGLLAAVMAARSSVMIPPGESPDFLAPLPLDSLVHAAMERGRRTEAESLAEVLARLGLHTLGQFAALPAGDVLARFGPIGAWARRMALGLDVAPPVLRRTEEDIAVEQTFEDPAERIEQLGWAARDAAERLDSALLDAGVRCGKVRIVARTVKGDLLERVWRTDVATRAGAFASHMTDRVRWQLEGWLSGLADGPEPAPLTSLALVAEDVVALGDEQSYLWGGSSGGDARARRALERLQGLLGIDGVIAVAEQGGRSPRDRVHALAWGQEGQAPRRIEHPWPGRIPEPAPATVLPVSAPIQVLDAGGTPVVVDRRLAVSAPPTWVRLPADPRDAIARAAHRHPSSGHVGGDDGPVWERARPVEAWAGPWPVAERWWAPDADRRAYMQLALQTPEGEPGLAILAAFSGGRWQLEALYD
ncbi:DNA polymerase Y family protein [Demequina zhanjiangensis]|uniref:DNA polymerase Y family protein n=1 Tax=Demequina zhanjiangensis TaxID=3051659 RepID=A0ABT8G2D8_9MICO|nr:DNA polymerase Y family protein [Demequina sp. SYSU T00b26]MDN4473109.1 DNA polymerase Y family protein [Demequina sp. SYSU T00b26]